MVQKCKRDRVARYLADTLEVDEKLEFLYHLEHCIHCWEEVYNSMKAEHPHYYRQTSRNVKFSEKELARIEASGNEAVEDELIGVA
ncbi:MAG: hypothetical protein HY645_14235 [Acidobacteria bacterium]|nr:hypothetical protein [Acidobacteriota bacterium]